MHGDAAFAGQGVVAESLGLSGLQRLPHRRHDPLHRQQPDRLHHRPALLALLALSVRRRQDGPGADLPRQRRRPGGGGLRRQGGDRVPPEVRARRWSSTCSATAATATTRATSRPSPSRSCTSAIREHPTARRSTPSKLVERGRRHRRRGRGDEGRLARRSSTPSSRPRQALQAQQGRLARRRLGRHQGRAEDDDPRRGDTGVPIETLQRGRPAHDRGAGRLRRPPHDRSACSRRGAR